MPIRPENRARYPREWPVISATIRERAGYRCEGSPDFPDCRVPDGELGARVDGHWFSAEPIGDDGLRRQWPKPGSEAFCVGYPQRLRIVRIVLTVAHLDHQPENCDPENLRAWCQRCHLHYDRVHHAQTAARTRREGKAAADLFEGGAVA